MSGVPSVAPDVTGNVGVSEGAGDGDVVTVNVKVGVGVGWVLRLGVIVSRSVLGEYDELVHEWLIQPGFEDVTLRERAYAADTAPVVRPSRPGPNGMPGSVSYGVVEMLHSAQHALLLAAGAFS